MKSMDRPLVVPLILFLVILMFSSHPVWGEIKDNEKGNETTLLKENRLNLEAAKTILDKLNISGTLEANGFYEKDYQDVKTSDIILSAFELALDVRPVEWATGHAALLWEEDDTEPIDMDEGFIRLEKEKSSPFFLQIGKMYLPFGRFETNMISDSLPLEISETRETALNIGVNKRGFCLSAFVYNGDIDEAGQDNEIACYGFNAGYEYESNDLLISCGGGWTNHLIDSDGLGEWAETVIADAAAAALTTTWELRDYVSGWNLFVVGQVGAFTLTVEYTGAVDHIEWNVSDLTPGAAAALGYGAVETGGKFEARHAEIGYTFNLFDRETVVAAAYQDSDDCVDILPEKRYLGVIGSRINDALSVALEYRYDEDYDLSEGGSGESADRVECRIALTF